MSRAAAMSSILTQPFLAGYGAGAGLAGLRRCRGTIVPEPTLA